ncbi:MAG: N-acetyl-gamma-glutamyl-phosphate reductase [Myxococcota bacterium]
MTSILVFGASGYSGLELCASLARHPVGRLVGASSDKLRGQPIRNLAPAADDLAFLGHAELLEHAAQGQIAFLATPAETSLDLAPKLLDRGVRVIDLSGAFRLRDASLYPTWYGFTHPRPELLAEAAYGLPELVEWPVSARLVANPGCYATAAALAAAPLVGGGLIEDGPLILDGKSGTTGAGRRGEEAYSFSEVADTVRPYRLGLHQHVPEIEQTLAGVGAPRQVSFTPHLIPMRRGLLVSGYARARAGVDTAKVRDAYRARYAGRSFVRYLEDRPAEPGPTLHTNVCLVSAYLDMRTGIVSFYGALDNLVKGAAGQALQNLDRLLGV